MVSSTTTTYIYSGSKPIAEYVGASNPSLSKEYIYAGSRLLATVAGTTTTYHHPDHLSNRAETDKNGTRIRTFGHFPFGETWYEPTGTDKFELSHRGEIGRKNLTLTRFESLDQQIDTGADEFLIVFCFACIP